MNLHFVSFWGTTLQHQMPYTVHESPAIAIRPIHICVSFIFGKANMFRAFYFQAIQAEGFVGKRRTSWWASWSISAVAGPSRRFALLGWILDSAYVRSIPKDENEWSAWRYWSRAWGHTHRYRISRMSIPCLRRLPASAAQPRAAPVATPAHWAERLQKQSSRSEVCSWLCRRHKTFAIGERAPTSFPYEYNCHRSGTCIRYAFNAIKFT